MGVCILDFNNGNIFQGFIPMLFYLLLVIEIFLLILRPVITFQFNYTKIYHFNSVIDSQIYAGL